MTAPLKPSPPGTASLTVSNATFAGVRPKLSVLIPFFKESPVDLLRSLEAYEPEAIEIILIDDGSQMPELTAAVTACIEQSKFACALITLPENEGRARGRNRLTAAARAGYYLFLDSDMLPDAPYFLDRWMATIRSNPPVVFGGFSLKQAPADYRFEVHRAMAAHSDCLNAKTRSLTPEKYVFTSNLLIRRDVFEAEGFDPEFTGWGWEDVEWAMRVSAGFGIVHIDNPATHMGLDTPQSLARKYEQSVENFARVIRKHPHVVSQYPSYKIAKLLKFVPLLSLVRKGFKAAALGSIVPLRLRALALRLYRTALYAQVV